MPAGVGACIITQTRATTHLATLCISRYEFNRLNSLCRAQLRVTRGNVWTKSSGKKCEIKFLYGIEAGAHGFDVLRM